MAGIVDIVRHEVDQYAGEGINATIYPVFDELRQIYTVISIGEVPEDEPARAMIMAQVRGEQVIILVDTTDKPLVDALVQAGIPRSQIILVYAGEIVPEGA